MRNFSSEIIILPSCIPSGDIFAMLSSTTSFRRQCSPNLPGNNFHIFTFPNFQISTSPAPSSAMFSKIAIYYSFNLFNLFNLIQSLQSLSISSISFNLFNHNQSYSITINLIQSYSILLRARDCIEKPAKAGALGHRERQRLSRSKQKKDYNLLANSLERTAPSPILTRTVSPL